jgi:hypothetical protein
VVQVCVMCTDQPLEWKLQEEQIGRLLVLSDFTQRHSAWPVARLFTIGRRAWFSHCDSMLVELRMSCPVQCVRLLPDSRLEPVLTLPPRDGRALLRLVGVLGAIATR